MLQSLRASRKSWYVVLPVAIACLAIFFIVGWPVVSQRPENLVNPLTSNHDAIQAGQVLYARTCAVCHGSAGQGGRGPSLVSGVFHHGSADGEVFWSIRAGIQGSQMPSFPKLSNDQIWQIIVYLRDLSGVAGSQASAVEEKVPGDAAAGKIIVEGKGRCLLCHSVNGTGKAVGPDLSNAAAIRAARLKTKILNPNFTPAGGPAGPGSLLGPATVFVLTRDGHQYRGALKNSDSFEIALVDMSGTYHSFDRSQVREVRVENASLMPSDYAKRLSADEIQNVVAYLKTLNGSDPAGILSWERLLHSEKEPQNYMTYWGDLGGKHYSALSQINITNVSTLQAKWALPLPGNGSSESIPLVVDGIMYTIGPVVGSLEVMAVDARTGRVLWRYERKQKVTNPNEINRTNRGVAVAGNRLFFGTLDAFLIALDARTGEQLWETKVADTMRGYSITSPPLPVKDKIITGIAGGEFDIQGFLEAHDQTTGTKVWRFNTVPQPGEAGHDTWDGDSWQRGGSPTWLPGSYDPDLNLLYWSVGNPGPVFNGDVRKGDNLYSCSVIALNPDTGKLKWHYQFTPNDTHDWDSTEDMVLVDRVWHGLNRKLLLHADRNGVFYVLDRAGGKFLAGNPFVRATWVQGWNENGRPITTKNRRSDDKGQTIYPAVGGGTNFQAPSYSPQTGWMYFMYHDGPEKYVSGPEPFEPGAQYNGRGTRRPAFLGPGEAPPSDGIQAFDPDTGKTQWRFPLSQGGLSPGLLATAGGVVFAASSEGNFLALDAKTGKPLWHFTTGVGIESSPMSYSVGGKQFVAITSSNVVYSFGLPE